MDAESVSALQSDTLTGMLQRRGSFIPAMHTMIMSRAMIVTTGAVGSMICVVVVMLMTAGAASMLVHVIMVMIVCSGSILLAVSVTASTVCGLICVIMNVTAIAQTTGVIVRVCSVRAVIMAAATGFTLPRGVALPVPASVSVVVTTVTGRGCQGLFRMVVTTLTLARMFVTHAMRLSLLLL